MQMCLTDSCPSGQVEKGCNKEAVERYIGKHLLKLEEEKKEGRTGQD